MSDNDRHGNDEHIDLSFPIAATTHEQPKLEFGDEAAESASASDANGGKHNGEAAAAQGSGASFERPTVHDSNDSHGSDGPAPNGANAEASGHGAGNAPATDETEFPAARDVVDTTWGIPPLDFADVTDDVTGDGQGSRSAQSSAGASSASAETQAFTPRQLPNVGKPIPTTPEEEWVFPEYAANRAANATVAGVGSAANAVATGAGPAAEGTTRGSDAPTAVIGHAQSAGQSQPTQTRSQDAAETMTLSGIGAFAAADGAGKTAATGAASSNKAGSANASGSAPSFSSVIGEKNSRASEPAKYADQGDGKHPGGKSRTGLIVGIVIAVIVVIALAVGGVLIWRNRQDSSAKQAALTACEEAYSKYGDANDALQKALNGSKTAQTVTASQVADSKTVDALKKAVTAAKSVAQAQECASNLNSAELNTRTGDINKLVDTITTATQNVTSAANAVTASQSKKTQATETATKDQLQTAVTDAQTLLNNSLWNVADDTTRTTLAAAIDAANALLQQDDPDTKAMQDAMTQLQTASDAVNASMQALAEQNAAAQQQAQNQTTTNQQTVPTPTPEVTQCGANQTLVNGVCQDNAVTPPPTCGTNQELVNGVCQDKQPVTPTPPVQCPEGQVVENGQCVSKTDGSPSDKDSKS